MFWQIRYVHWRECSPSQYFSLQISFSGSSRDLNVTDLASKQIPFFTLQYYFCSNFPPAYAIFYYKHSDSFFNTFFSDFYGRSNWLIVAVNLTSQFILLLRSQA